MACVDDGPSNSLTHSKLFGLFFRAAALATTREGGTPQQHQSLTLRRAAAQFGIAKDREQIKRATNESRFDCVASWAKSSGQLGEKQWTFGRKAVDVWAKSSALLGEKQRPVG
jgi:hypothetical protein